MLLYCYYNYNYVLQPCEIDFENNTTTKDCSVRVSMTPREQALALKRIAARNADVSAPFSSRTFFCWSYCSSLSYRVWVIWLTMLKHLEINDLFIALNKHHLRLYEFHSMRRLSISYDSSYLIWSLFSAPRSVNAKSSSRAPWSSCGRTLAQASCLL